MAGNFFHKIEESVTGHKHSDTHAAVDDPNAPTSDGYVPASGGYYNPGTGGDSKSSSSTHPTSGSTAGAGTYDDPDRGAVSRSEEEATGEGAHETGSLGSSTGGTHHGQRGITHTSAEGTGASAGNTYAGDETSTGSGGLTSRKEHTSTTETSLGSGTSSGDVFASDPTSASQSGSASQADYTSSTGGQTSGTGSTIGQQYEGRAFAEALEGQDGNLHDAGALNSGATLRGRLHGENTTASQEYGA